MIPFRSRQDRIGRSAAYYLHLGIYAYRRDFLLQFASWRPTPLEKTEKLEQLRALEHGSSIYVMPVERATHGIDTPEQYEEFVQRYRSGSAGVSSQLTEGSCRRCSVSKDN